MKLKEMWNKFWFLLWKDDSLKGWIFSILFIFVFIKFIFFPALSFLTGTSLPLAIVESCSMYHDGNLFSNYGKWTERHGAKYSQFEIEGEDFEEFDFKSGLNKGDILFIVGTKAEKLELGDVIIFNGGTNNPIIHRVVGIKKENESLIFSTIGDNNNGQILFEKSISPERIIGKPVLKLVPYLGWVKLVFYEGPKSISEKGFCDEN